MKLEGDKKKIEKVVHEGKAAQPHKVRIQLKHSKLGTCVIVHPRTFKAIIHIIY